VEFGPVGKPCNFAPPALTHFDSHPAVSRRMVHGCCNFKGGPLTGLGRLLIRFIVRAWMDS
jgi:hypothetical protein